MVTVAGNGLTENVSAEIDRALNDHELIKIKLVTEDRNDKQALTDAICKNNRAQLIQSIGHVILVFRKAKTPDPRLSNLLR